MSELGEGVLTIRELVTKLGFDVDEHKLEGFERGMETAKVAAEALTIAWNGLVLGLFELTRETAEYGEEVEINSQLLGISTEHFQKLRYAAQAFGIENENIITGLRFFNKNLGDAQHGMGEGVIAFNRLGMSMQDLKSMPVDKILAHVADRMHGIANSSERAAISVKLFGRGGAHFGQFLSQGSGVISQLGEQLNGLFMTKEQVEQGQKTHAALIQTRAILTALRNEVGVRLFPVVQQLSKGFLDWVMANKKMIEQRIDHYVRLLTDAVAAGWTWLQRMYVLLERMVHAMGGLDNVVQLLGIALLSTFGARVIGSIGEAAKALRELGMAAALADAEALLIPLAIAAVLIALDDLRGWMSGEKSVLGEWFGPFEDIKKKLAGFLEPLNLFFKGLKDMWTGIKDVFSGGFDAMMDLWRGNFHQFFLDMKRIAEGDVSIFKGLGEVIGGAIFAGVKVAMEAGLDKLSGPMRLIMGIAAMAGGGPMNSLIRLYGDQIAGNVVKKAGGAVSDALSGPPSYTMWQQFNPSFVPPASSSAGPSITNHITMHVPFGTPPQQHAWLQESMETIANKVFADRLSGEVAHVLHSVPLGE